LIPTEVHELLAAGTVMAKPDDIRPWETAQVSRATWYRLAAAGELDAFVRRLGRSYRILLLPYLHWLGAPPDADPHEREVPAAVQPPARGRDQCARDELTP